MSYGIVVCKVDLGDGKVGIFANLHTMAYEGPDHLIDAALTEVIEVMHKFRQENVSSEEKLMFDVICGDFNFDNMSPCDKVSGENDIFKQYSDIAAVKLPGQDQVSVKHSHLTMNHIFFRTGQLVQK